jgi:alkanesulfonate monooxygenase SsuD/methylene tetrahydromethanopterin reductase-like flavin-dependent oxidoreductase (luciferase family)
LIKLMMREKILITRALWTEEEASFTGEALRLVSSWAWPKPVQKPHPPIVLGAASGPKTLADVVEYCDRWIPLATRHDIAGQVDMVRAAVADAGRDPGGLRGRRYSAKTHQVAELGEAGVDRAVFNLPPLGKDLVIPKLDEWVGAVVPG